MKLLAILSVLLISTVTFARSTSYSNSYSLTAPTEEQAVAKAQAILPSVLNMNVKKIILKGRYAKCRFRSNRRNPISVFRVTGVGITKLYKITDNQVIEPYYRASIRFVFGQCKESNRD
ncbi:MAG: hypothetical protein BM556_12950 [Bacteriovorax sp. MedPE-SWde]|nr:MAG: hypothetical protein BM556_12950 [Bacteriovorax sp. MedPE-SWde]